MTHQWTGINLKILDMVMRISFCLPGGYQRYFLPKRGGEAEQWQNVHVVEFRPNTSFTKDALVQNQISAR